MFIKTNTFRKMLKAAYKEERLHLACLHDETLVISTGFQVINVMKDKLLPQEKAAIIEFAGELPDIGEAFLCTKGGNQTEDILATDDWYFLDSRWEEASTAFAETYVMIAGKYGETYRAVQHMATKIPEWYQENFMAMVTEPSREDEIFTREMRVNYKGYHGDPVLMYKSNFMTLAIWPAVVKNPKLNELLTKMELWKDAEELEKETAEEEPDMDQEELDIEGLTS